MKINSKVHGAIDFLMVLILWVSPTLFGLGSITSIFAYGLGAVHLALSLCTNYEYGLVKLVQFKIHGIIELVVSIVLVPIAFYLGSLEGELSRNYFLGIAAAIFVVWLLSDYTNKPFDSKDMPYIDSNTDGGMI